MPEAAKMGFNDLIKWSLDITNGVQGRIINTEVFEQGSADEGSRRLRVNFGVRR